MSDGGFVKRGKRSVDEIPLYFQGLFFVLFSFLLVSSPSSTFWISFFCHYFFFIILIIIFNCYYRFFFLDLIFSTFLFLIFVCNRIRVRVSVSMFITLFPLNIVISLYLSLSIYILIYPLFIYLSPNLLERNMAGKYVRQYSFLLRSLPTLYHAVCKRRTDLSSRNRSWTLPKNIVSEKNVMISF